MTGSIGALRNRIAIQETTLVPDGAGGFEPGWRTLADTWATFRPIGSNEAYENGLVTSRTTHKVTVRYRKDIHPSMRLTLEGRAFEVLAAVDETDRRDRLTLYVEETRA